MMTPTPWNPGDPITPGVEYLVSNDDLASLPPQTDLVATMRDAGFLLTVEPARIVHDTADTPVCWACPGPKTCDRECDVAERTKPCDRDDCPWAKPHGHHLRAHEPAQIAARMDADAEAHDVATTSPLNEEKPR